MTEAATRAVIVGVQLQDVSDEEHASSLAELKRLAETLGLEVIATVTQKRAALSKAAVVGEGKLKELAVYTGGSGVIPSAVPQKDRKNLYIRTRQAEDEGDEEEPAEAPVRSGRESFDSEPEAPPTKAGVVLVDHDLTPSQARNLERAVEAEVLDRTAVILAIFERHARSREAKLEIEIARLAYMAPRLREVGGGGDRQRGGIGGRGAGESSMELDRRKVRDRISELRRELEAIEKTRSVRRARRSEQHLVTFVGYTNAGKSSLMRGLTGSEVYVADKLFATLETTIRALRPETKPRILVSDTVGFIKKLPHGLVASFRATLEAAGEAHLLLHVIDASDPAFRAHIEVTRAVLAEIGVDDTPVIQILNKIDRLDPKDRPALAAEYPKSVLMSAKNAVDVAALHDRIAAFFEKELVEAELLVPYAMSALTAEIHETSRVVSEEHGDLGTKLNIRAAPKLIQRFRAALA